MSLSDVIHPAMCPGPVYTGLITAKLEVRLGNLAGRGERDPVISILSAARLHHS